MPTVDELYEQSGKAAQARAAAEEWSPPVLPPMPDTTGWGAADLERLALERCTLRGDTQQRRGREPVACRRCLQEALTGVDPLLAADVGGLFRLLPDSAGPTHRRLLTILADRGERDLRTLMELTEASETNCSARLRDLRQYGYPIARRVHQGRPLYRLAT
jgi:biotin operon repressor